MITKNNKPVGATCEVKYIDDNDPDSFSVWYISFSQWVDDATHDPFGVKDEEIAYYCPDGETELKSLMKKDNGNEFWIESYELAYGFKAIK
jgi:hypothetical protein